MGDSIQHEKVTLLQQLNNGLSKTQTISTSDFILSKPHLLQFLYQLTNTDNNKIQWRAAWVLEHVFLANPNLITPYIQDITTKLQNIRNDGVKRHFAKILSLCDINGIVDGIFINTCFDWLISEAIPVAVKVHCMQILFNLTKKFPELKPELKIVLEEQIPNNSIGFKSRATKIIKAL